MYEKISDEELDFFEEENAKACKPAALEDIDWATLAAIAPPSKTGIYFIFIIYIHIHYIYSYLIYIFHI